MYYSLFSILLPQCFFLADFVSLYRSENCGLVRGRREYSLWGSGLLVSPREAILSRQWNICLLKRSSLTSARCWTCNSSLLEWKIIIELLVCWFWILCGWLPKPANLSIIVLSDRRNGGENLPAQSQTFHHTIIMVIKFSSSYSPLQ